MGTRRGRLVAASAVLAVVAAAVAVVGPTRSAPAGAAPVGAGAVVELRPLSSRDGRIVDDLGRDVLLRGANVNALGEYWQGVPSIPATLPMTDADWDLMAAHGFSVVRLIVTWSRVQPTRAAIDQGYLDVVDAHVRAAADRGIYTVIDMHQDAYTATIATTDPAECPPGTSPARGWDGAPAWATITDGLSTCLTNGDRNSSPAVTRAWNHFYDDTDGIRTEFAGAWGAIATRFAGRPEIAGYDLLNEPEVSAPAAELAPKYQALLRDVALAIRAAEDAAPFDHLLFVEPAIPAGNLANGIVIPDPDAVGVGTDNVVSAPHNYAESIQQGLTIEQMSQFMVSTAQGLGLPTWIGEYGFWSTDDATMEKVGRYAADEDHHAIGGAWWQWRQSCGDPHGVRWEGSEVVSFEATSTHLNLLDCPDNANPRPNEAFLDVLGRGYPRATPGRIVDLVSDPASGELTVDAEAAAADVGRRIVVWTPTVDGPDHRVVVTGLGDVVEHEVPGGRIVTAEVLAAGAYQLRIGVDPDEPETTTTLPVTTTTTATTTTDGPTTTTEWAEIGTATSIVRGGSATTAGERPGTGPRSIGASRSAVAVRSRPTYTG